MACALIPMAPGVEEMEAVIVIDTLRRAGWRVVAAGLTGLDVTASRGVRILCDALWSDITISEFDVIVIPGGAAGTDALAAEQSILDAVRFFAQSNRIAAAICAGPLVLQAAGVLAGRRATCHPAVRAKLDQPAEISNDRVVIDGRIITSQGPGTAMEFALAILAAVDGSDARSRVAAGLVL